MIKVWKILYHKKLLDPSQIVSVLLENRKIDHSKSDGFLNPSLLDLNLEKCGIDKEAYKKFKKRLDMAIEKEEKIIIFGDYDVDGICASAILWECLYTKTKNVFPYIPDRADEGYGLSKKGIDNVLVSHPDTKLIITVDNGIVAFEPVDYATKLGIDVIVTDHHVKGDRLPDAYCIVHTTSLCGAGIAWILTKELSYEDNKVIEQKLELACLATIADLVPLIGANRAIVKYGLEKISSTKRIGLIELMSEAGIENKLADVYTVGHQIAPRLNATGRIQSAMNALRLLCTNDPQKAITFAKMLNSVNKDRQGLTDESVEHAKLLALESSYSNKITIVAHESYNQGVIGLIASHLVESYYKPAFAISKGEEKSKGSARSIAGVNIIELLRSVGDTLIEAGGHPMAAGFSVETKRIDEFINALVKKSDEVVFEDLLSKKIEIDMELEFDLATIKLTEEIEKLSPFGMANPEPVFATYGVEIVEFRKIGKQHNHLKLKVRKGKKVLDAIAFGWATKTDVVIGDTIDIAYILSINQWNNKKSLQLRIRDIKPTAQSQGD